jgi:sugar phosphate isomerase/epimerase
MIYTRRDLGKIALAGVPLASAFGAAKLNSKIRNVQFGTITYSLRAMNLDIDGSVKAVSELGLSEVELMNEVAERYAGLPAPAGRGGGGRAAAAPGGPGAGPGAGAGPGGGGGQGGPRGGRAPLTPEQQAANLAAQRAAGEATKKWRLGASMDKYKEVRKKFKDAGVEIQVLCFNMPMAISDEEIDYAFQMAKALGAKAISSTSQVPVAKRVAQFADKHKLLWGGHGHSNLTDPNEFATPASFETIMSYSKYIGINLDIGHFTAANFDPIPFIKQHGNRITNLHVKDRRKNQGPNTIFGEGDTPIKEVLQLVSKEKYKFPCNIEFEYAVPQGSDVMTEMKKCVQYCKDALA